MKKEIEYTVEFLGIDRPSKALRAMIEGLREADARPTFRISMRTFGEYDKGQDMCFGCAATCTLMKLTGKERLVKELYEGLTYQFATPGHVLSGGNPEDAYVNYHCSDSPYIIFEAAIDHLRQGFPKRIFDFFGFYPVPIEVDQLNLPSLGSLDWKDYIQYYEKALIQWEEAGY